MMASHVAPNDRLYSVWDQVGGVRVHGRISAHAGVGTPIVFVHGLGVSLRYMEPTMSWLASSFHVVGLDLPGFGRSATPPRPLDVPRLADTLAQWLDVRGIGPAILVGNSFGCQVIVECVTTQPGRARGIVLNAPTMDPAHRTILGQLLRVIADIPKEPASLAWIVARDYLRAGPRALLATLRYALAHHIEEQLPAVAVPALVVCGARDPVVTVRWASEVARLTGLEVRGAPGATLQCVADAAHALPYDDPDTFGAIIRDFASSGALGAPRA